MAHMNDSLALLREDRELLNRDVLVEREANKKLTEENDQVRRALLSSNDHRVCTAGNSPLVCVNQTAQDTPG
jgi:hypothetical protein